MTWQLNDLTQRTGAPAPHWQTCGLVNLEENTESVLYIDGNYDLQELRYAGDWALHTLTQANNGNTPPSGTGVPGPANQSLFPNVAPATANGQLIYVGHATGTLYSLGWDRGSQQWLARNILTNLEPAPDPIPVPASTKPCAFLWPGVGTLHGLFRGAQGSIHEVVSSNQGNSWTHTTVSAALGHPAASDPVGLVMFDYPPGEIPGEKHMFYVDTAGHIQHLSAAMGEVWKRDPVQLDVQAGAPQGTNGRGPVPAGALITAWAFNPPSQTEDTLHVVYRDAGGHMNELVLNNYQEPGVWVHNDLSANAANAPYIPVSVTPALGNPVGYVFEVEGTQHVVYLGTNHKICELYWSRDDQGNYRWQFNDFGTVAELPAAAGDPSAYCWESQQTQHVIFVSQGPNRVRNGQIPGGHICELYKAA